MTTVAVNVSPELAQRLQSLSDRLPDILELLATRPYPEEILALQPSEDLQTRVQEILEKNRADGLSPAEEREWQRA